MMSVAQALDKYGERDVVKFTLMLREVDYTYNSQSDHFVLRTPEGEAFILCDWCQGDGIRWALLHYAPDGDGCDRIITTGAGIDGFFDVVTTAVELAEGTTDFNHVSTRYDDYINQGEQHGHSTRTPQGTAQPEVQHPQQKAQQEDP